MKAKYTSIHMPWLSTQQQEQYANNCTFPHNKEEVEEELMSIVESRYVPSSSMSSTHRQGERQHTTTIMKRRATATRWPPLLTHNPSCCCSLMMKYFLSVFVLFINTMIVSSDWGWDDTTISCCLHDNSLSGQRSSSSSCCNSNIQEGGRSSSSSSSSSSLFAAAFPTGVTTTTGQLNVSYYFPTGLDDLGYTFQYNVGRIATLRRLREVYGTQLTFRQQVYYSVNDWTNAAFTASVVRDIEVLGCTLIFFVTNGMVARLPGKDDFAKQYNNTVRFIEFNNNRWLAGPGTLSNIAGTTTAIQHGLYLAGAAAGSGCTAGSPVLMVIPNRNFAHSADAFHRGMLFGQSYRPDFVTSNPQQYPGGLNSTMCPLYVISQNTFANPISEVEIAQLAVSIGVSVVLYWANDLAASYYLSSLEKNASAPLRNIFTIPMFTDGTLVIGDTVLTSLVIEAQTVFFNGTADWIEGKNLTDVNYLIALQPGEMRIGGISARAPKSVSVAVNAAVDNLRVLGSPICGPLYDSTMTLRVPNGSCLTTAQMFTINYYEYGIQTLPDYVPSATCGPGTFTRRNQSTFTLSCIPCPSGLVAPSNGTRECRRCEVGWVADASQQACVFVGIPDTSATMSGGSIAAITVVLSALFLGLVGWYVWMALIVHNKNMWWLFVASDTLPHMVVEPPRGPKVALAMLAIDPKRSDPRWRRSLNFVGEVYAALDQIIVPICIEMGVYVAINVGDVFVLVHDNPRMMLKALLLMDDAFQRASREQNSVIGKTKLKLRILLHHCQPTIILPTPKNPRAQYCGNAIRVLKLLWNSTEVSSHTCSIVMNTSAAKAISNDPDLEWNGPSSASARLQQQQPPARSSSSSVPNASSRIRSEANGIIWTRGKDANNGGKVMISVTIPLAAVPKLISQQQQCVNGSTDGLHNGASGIIPIAAGGSPSSTTTSATSGSSNNNTSNEAVTGEFSLVAECTAAVTNEFLNLMSITPQQLQRGPDGKETPQSLELLSDLGIHGVSSTSQAAAAVPSTSSVAPSTVASPPQGSRPPATAAATAGGRRSNRSAARGARFTAGSSSSESDTTSTGSQSSTTPSGSVMLPFRIIHSSTGGGGDVGQQLNMLSVEVYRHLTKLGNTLLASFAKICAPDRRMDLLLYACSRLRIELVPGLTLPRVEPDTPFAKYASRVHVPASIFGTASPLSATTEQPSAAAAAGVPNGTDTLSTRIAKIALKLLTEQVIISMDEVELERWCRDVGDIRQAALSKDTEDEDTENRSSASPAQKLTAEVLEEQDRRRVE